MLAENTDISLIESMDSGEDTTQLDKAAEKTSFKKTLRQIANLMYLMKTTIIPKIFEINSNVHAK